MGKRARATEPEVEALDGAVAPEGDSSTGLVEEILDETRSAPAKSESAATKKPAPGMRSAKLVSIAPCRVVVSGREMDARVDESVSAVVLEGAVARGERVVVEVEDDGEVVVVGALRTQPTPGIDAADQYTIEAGRIDLKAEHEVSMSAKTALVVLRAIGEVETVAERITTRAHGVHKIIGRMLRLN